jgi:hypothetical protein
MHRASGRGCAELVLVIYLCSHHTTTMITSLRCFSKFSDMLLMIPISLSPPLYLIWTSRSTNAYAGTCIFLSILSVLFRFLVAFESVLEKHRIDVEIDRRHFMYAKEPAPNELINSDEKSVLLPKGTKGNSILVRHDMDIRPWRRTLDCSRAATDSLIVGILYLL